MKILHKFIFAFFLTIINGYFFNFLNDNFFHLKRKMPKDISTTEIEFVAIIIAPVIETLLFQVILYYVLATILKIKNDIFCTIFMSILFALMHNYHWLYIVTTFFSGVIINIFYISIQKIKPNYSYILTVLIHALYNLYGALFVV